MHEQINSDKCRGWKYIQLSNGLIQSYENCYMLTGYEYAQVAVVLGDIRKIKMVWYCHKIPRYDGIVIVTKF